MKKYLSILAILIGLVVFIGATNHSAFAATIEELQAQIQKLLETIRALQAQIPVVPTTITIPTRPPITTCPFVSIMYLGYSETLTSEVKELQNLLKRYPNIYPEGLVTGYFGKLTDAALRRFQQQYGIVVTGQTGPETRAKLCELWQNQQIPPVTGTCGWCGTACIKKTTNTYCPDVMPPENTICQEINGVCQITKVTPTTIETCAKEGEIFSPVYDSVPKHCCSGLTEWMSGMDSRIVQNGKCVETGLLKGSPTGTCIKCGDGICGLNENICNCPQDCSIPTTTTIVKTRYSCTTALGTLSSNNYPTCVPSDNGIFNSLEECQTACRIPLTRTCSASYAAGALTIGQSLLTKEQCLSLAQNTKDNIRYSVCSNIGVSDSETIYIKWGDEIINQFSAQCSTFTMHNTCEQNKCVRTPGIGENQCYQDSDCLKIPCTDSDGGRNYYTKGTVSYNGQTYTDTCIESRTADCPAPPTPCPPSQIVYYVQEYYCENGVMKQETHQCGTGLICEDGVCKLTPPTTIITSLPDLIIPMQTGVVLSAPINNPKVGDVYAYFDVTIKNIGTATAIPSSNIYGGLDVICALNHYPTSSNDPDIVLGVMFTQPLAINSTATSYRVTTGADSPLLKSSGNKHIYCTIDPYNKIAELNESNNNYEFWITVDPSNITCTDSDGGKNYYIKGTVTYGSLQYTDYCSSLNSVDEYYCENNVYYRTTFTCPSGYTCVDGACRPTVTTTIVPPPLTAKCSDGTYCGWCGSQCTKIGLSDSYCPQVTPPVGYDCVCNTNNTCLMQPTKSGLEIMDILNKLTASLMSLMELLK